MTPFVTSPRRALSLAQIRNLHFNRWDHEEDDSTEEQRQHDLGDAMAVRDDMPAGAIT